MESIFAEIETYPVKQQSDWPNKARPMNAKQRAATSRTSDSDFEDLVASPNAAIGDEQAAEQQRQQDLKRRVVELEALFFEDYGVPLQEPSRLAFECFMKYRPMVNMPLLGAEPAGTLIATWTKESECLSLRFSDRFHLDFAVTYKRGLEDVRRWGKSTLGNVFSECPEAKRLASA